MQRLRMRGVIIPLPIYLHGLQKDYNLGKDVLGLEPLSLNFQIMHGRNTDLVPVKWDPLASVQLLYSTTKKHALLLLLLLLLLFSGTTLFLIFLL
jgi:hypothetical protein